MAFGTGEHSITLEDVLARTTEFDILYHYFNVSELPTIIHSPLRQDNRPSFGLYTLDGKRVHYTDLATKDRGGLFDLLMKYWGESYKDMLNHLWKDLPNFSNANVQFNSMKSERTYQYQSLKSRNIDLQCKVREWRDYDIEYWASYGISLEWLKYADIYPISHKIVIRDGQRYVFGADKYAYAYVERKEGKVTLKIYQPYNKGGYKWSSSIDRSVWGLWTKIPKYGDNLIISSSVKDCLNIMCNLGIPAICMQGEGYKPKPQIIEELKGRYKNIILFYDNDYNNPDNPGRKDSIELSLEYNLKRVEIPVKYESKDPSDLFKKYGKDRYLEIMNEILKDVLWKKNGDQ